MIQHEGIHHVSIIVTDLQQAKTFYEEIIGLKEIERPPFDFPGAWYAIGPGGQQLHLIVHNGETLRSSGIDTRDGHFAIRVADFEATLDWLRQRGVEHKANPNSITGFGQIYVTDPDRNVIELNAAKVARG
ncbi:VOC family protein [Paenibacillus humicola]|uniref:VOC family protein n=1 Tax=Paenibacillus humicola TaxID=3110540 RepID=UPI00237A894B|nr:VOC family protein [Paenibacillus humicola]